MTHCYIKTFFFIEIYSGATSFFFYRLHGVNVTEFDDGKRI